MKRNRCVKIVATLGPVSSDQEQIAKLFYAGADVFRINMSHTSHERLDHLVKTIRFVELKTRRPIGVLVDLQGPKLRLGTFINDKIEVGQGDRIVLDNDPQPGDGTRMQIPHPEILDALKPGHTLLIDDGKVRLVVEQASDEKIVARVMVGGTLSNRKGISVPDTTLAVSAMTAKDRADLQAALELNVDWVALSFVQRPEDVLEVKEIVAGRANILAKIEKPQAVQRFDDILACSDAIMVARGDLGVEIPLQKVPGIQKQIIEASRAAGKPVVVATQMLESMISHPVPTRAEVSDVATAIFEGADAIMLSAESAAGKYPVQAVATMNLIAEEIEQDPAYRPALNHRRFIPQKTDADAVAAAAREIADTMKMGAIACWTSSGATALRMARERPATEVLALSPNRETSRRLTLVWGVHCVVTEDARDLDDMVQRACSIARSEAFGKGGDKILAVAGVPLGTPGATNMLRIAKVASTV